MVETRIPLPTNEQMEEIISKMDTSSTDKFDFKIDKIDTSLTYLYTMDKSNGTLWARVGTDFCKSSDNGDTWIDTGGTYVLGEKNGTIISIREMLVTPDGNLLASTSPVGGLGGWIYRSTDEGVTWTEVYDWNVAEGIGSYILSQGWDVHPNYDGNGNTAIYVVEYNTDSSNSYTNKTLRTLRSIDDGQTFQIIDEQQFLGKGIRHWHFVIYDEFDNKLWLGSGDLAPHSKLFQITDGETVEYVNGGTYDWKFVSVVPYKGVLYCPSDRTDSGALPCPSYIYTKRQNKLEILNYEDGHSWYSTINKKFHLPFWMTQVNQSVSVSGIVKGYTADFSGSYEVFSVPSNWGAVTVPSATSYSWGDYIFVNLFSSALNPTSVAFLRLKITERGA